VTVTCLPIFVFAVTWLYSCWGFLFLIPLLLLFFDFPNFAWTDFFAYSPSGYPNFCLSHLFSSFDLAGFFSLSFLEFFLWNKSCDVCLFGLKGFVTVSLVLLARNNHWICDFDLSWGKWCGFPLDKTLPRMWLILKWDTPYFFFLRNEHVVKLAEDYPAPGLRCEVFFFALKKTPTSRLKGVD
jgi:hypothetical protein